MCGKHIDIPSPSVAVQGFVCLRPLPSAHYGYCPWEKMLDEVEKLAKYFGLPVRVPSFY